MYDFVAIIPARSKSSSVKNKNMTLFNRKPLMDYTIDSINPFGIDTYLLTDSEEYCNHAVEKGINYILEDEIGNSTKMDENLLPYIYPRFKGKHVVLLQPTSPLRLFGIIEKCLSKYNGDSLVTVEEFGDWCYNGNGEALFDRFNRPLRQSKDFKVYKYFDGNILIRNLDKWFEEKCIIGENPVLVKNSRINTIQVDTMEDVRELENVLRWKEID